MRLLLSLTLSLGLVSFACGGEGDDAACTAVCGDAYCRDFGMLPTPVCTENCTTPDDCADGWDCNDMGRCRPPG